MDRRCRPQHRSRIVRKKSHSAVALLVALAFTPGLQAQSLVTIVSVTVGDAGNSIDNAGYGAVINVFAVGQYGVSLPQCAAALPICFFLLTDSQERAMLEALGRGQALCRLRYGTHESQGGDGSEGGGLSEKSLPLLPVHC